MLHVDVVRNEAAVGRQTRVVHLFTSGEVVKAEGEEALIHSVLQPFEDPETGELISPDDPKLFLERLHAVLNGARLFATQAYLDESQSPFHDGPTLPMRVMAV